MAYDEAGWIRAERHGVERERETLPEGRGTTWREAGRQETTHLIVSATPHARFRVLMYTLEIPPPVLPTPSRRSTTVGGMKLKRETSNTDVRAIRRARRLPRWIYTPNKHTDDVLSACTRSTAKEK